MRHCTGELQVTLSISEIINLSTNVGFFSYTTHCFFLSLKMCLIAEKLHLWYFWRKSFIYERKFQILHLEREECSYLKTTMVCRSLRLYSRRDRRLLKTVLSLSPVAMQLFSNCKKCDILDKVSDWTICWSHIEFLMNVKETKLAWKILFRGKSLNELSSRKSKRTNTLWSGDTRTEKPHKLSGGGCRNEYQ